MKNVTIREKDAYIEMLESCFEVVTASVISPTVEIPVGTRLALSFVLRDLIGIAKEAEKEGDNE